MKERQEWIERRAFVLWEAAGRPNGRDLEFWLQAEIEHDHCCCGDLCILSPGSCIHQQSLPTTGGKHISVCLRHGRYCNNKVVNVNQVA